MNAKTLVSFMPASALVDTVRHIWENCNVSFDAVDAISIFMAALVDLVGIDEANKMVWDNREEVS